MKRFKIICCGFLLLVYIGCAQDKYRRASAEAYDKEAQKALVNKRCYAAQQLYRNLLSDFPGSHLVDNAQFGLGEAYKCEKDFVTAVFEYERLVKEYPASPFVDRAKFQIGESYFQDARGIHHDQDETRKAIREFKRFIEDYPNSELIPSAKQKIQDLRNKLATKQLEIAENYLKWKKYLSSKIYCEDILEQYGDTEVVDQARFLLARIKHRIGYLEEALEILTLLSTRDVDEGLNQEIIEEIQNVQRNIAEQMPFAGSGGQQSPKPLVEPNE